MPLESVAIEGSKIPQSAVLAIAGLRLAAPIDKAGIEQACGRLQESGLFASISYRCAPGARNGYALTLILADQTRLSAAVIDVPGADENEAWQWLTAKYRRFDRQVPESDDAQKFLAGEIERHLGAALRGQHLTAHMEADLRTHRVTVSFQPEVLPKIHAVTYSGNRAVASGELAAALEHVAIDAGYTERKFAAFVESNLRPVYEQHGFYRVQFAPGPARFSDAGVAVDVGVTEGAVFQLGKVELSGDDLPADKMLSAAKLPTGKPANWKQIQDGIWEMEKVVKRTGFFEAAAMPDRSFDDAAHILDLRIRVIKGPLYRFGEVRVIGIVGDLAERARRTWKHKPGDPYDYAYEDEFFQDFSRAFDFHNFRKYQALPKRGAGDHVMDIDLIFEPR